MNPKYTVDWFIAKFEAIPEELWKTGSIGLLNNPDSPKCLLGHCRSGYGDMSQEAIALATLLRNRDERSTNSQWIWMLNDGCHDYDEPQYSAYSHLNGFEPRERVLTYLRQIKEKGEK